MTQLSVFMSDVYDEINNAHVYLEIDGNDLIIQVPYPPGEPEDIIRTLAECEIKS